MSNASSRSKSRIIRASAGKMTFGCKTCLLNCKMTSPYSVGLETGCWRGSGIRKSKGNLNPRMFAAFKKREKQGRHDGMRNTHEMQFLFLLSPKCSSIFLRLCLETSLNRRYWSGRATWFTLHKVKTVVLCQNRIRALASFAGNIFDYINNSQWKKKLLTQDKLHI